MNVEYFEVWSRGQLVAAFRYKDHADIFVGIILLGEGRIVSQTREVKK